MWRFPLLICAATGAALLGLGMTAAQDPIELVAPDAPPAIAEVPSDVELPDEIAPAALASDPTSDPDLEVLTRGPVHEAYAEQFNYDPQPGLAISKKPPELVREVPPEVKPDDEDAIWVPGYWAWDDERADFLWVSGCWRVPPPDHRWVPGYWSPLEDGRYQWVSGFWTPISSKELSYLPTPPASLEEGPVGVAPANHFWVPGNWQYVNYSYSWSPGYYSPCYDDWMWIPSRYIWTPRGCIFVGGRWDYRLASRGCLFAPTYFRNPSRFYSARFYSPSVCLPTSAISLHLFVRPSYCHYYFGDYYAPRYRNSFNFWVSFGSRPRCYDPMFTYYNAHFRRQGIDYHKRMHDWNDHFTRHENLRPAHTFKGQVDMMSRRGDFAQSKQSQIGTSIAYIKRDPGELKFKPVDFEERKQLTVARKQAEMLGKQREKFEHKIATIDSDRIPRIANPGIAKPGENQGPPSKGPKPEIATLKLNPTAKLEAKRRFGDEDFTKKGSSPSARTKPIELMPLGVDKPDRSVNLLPLGTDGDKSRDKGRSAELLPLGVDPNKSREKGRTAEILPLGTDKDKPSRSDSDPNPRRGNFPPARIEGNATLPRVVDPKKLDLPQVNPNPVVPRTIQPPKINLPTTKGSDAPKIDRGPKFEAPKIERKIESPKIEKPKGRADFEPAPLRIERPAVVDSGPKFQPRIVSEPKPFSDGSGGRGGPSLNSGPKPRFESAAPVIRSAPSVPKVQAQPTIRSQPTVRSQPSIRQPSISSGGPTRSFSGGSTRSGGDSNKSRGGGNSGGNKRK